MAVANTLAYYDTAAITTVKILIEQATGFFFFIVSGFKSSLLLRIQK